MRSARVLAVLAVTQVLGWAAVSPLPVLAPQIATDLGLRLDTVFLAITVFFASMGLTAPMVRWAIAWNGARKTMAFGMAGLSFGLTQVAAVEGGGALLVAWSILGMSGAFVLTTVATAYLNALDPDRARAGIGALMVVTGMASSLSWPVTAWIASLGDWRGVFVSYTGLTLACLPLLWFGLPEVRDATPPEPKLKSGAHTLLSTPNFRRIALAMSLSGFVSFGLEAVGITLLVAMGTDTALAIGLAALLGVAKVGGRMLDLAGGSRWDALVTARMAAALMALGLVALWIGQGAGWALVVYLCLFGLASGAFAVARATLPLFFFPKGDYTAALSIIALPLNLIAALAPLILAVVLTRIGADAVLGVLIVLSLGTAGVLVTLRRPKG